MMPVEALRIRKAAPPVIGTVVEITATGTGTWTVPAGWNTAKIECLGAGGDGAAATGGNSGCGGSGGQYQSIASLAVTAGANMNYRVGLHGGTQGNSGAPGTADTFLGSGTTAYAQGGQTVASGAGNPPGAAHAAVGGATVRNGGNGGLTSGASWTGGGGGGAGGPTGVGAAGGNGANTSGGPGGAGGSGDGATIAGAPAPNDPNPGTSGTSGSMSGSGGAGGSNNGSQGGNGGLGAGGGGRGYSGSGSRGIGGNGKIRITCLS